MSGLPFCDQPPRWQDRPPEDPFPDAGPFTGPADLTDERKGSSHDEVVGPHARRTGPLLFRNRAGVGCCEVTLPKPVHQTRVEIFKAGDASPLLWRCERRSPL
jgi:hypothetical protein